MSDGLPFVVPLSRWRLGAVLIGTMALLALGAWLIIGARTLSRNPWAVRAVGVTFVALFGFITAVGLRRFFREGHALIIDREGFTDHSSVVALGFVPWSQVKGFALGDFQGRQFLVVKLAEPEVHLQKGRFWQRLLLRDLMAETGSPVNLSATTLKLGLGVIASKLMAVHAAWQDAQRDSVRGAPPPGPSVVATVNQVTPSVEKRKL